MRLFLDFLPVALFFIAYKTHGIYVATGVAIVGALAVTGISWIRHRRVEQMQLVTLALIVLLGGLTLMLNDSRFIQWKPTLVNWCFAAAFIGSAFIGEKPLIQRLLGAKLALPRPVWHRLNLAWTGFFFLTGALNLYVAYAFSEAFWVNFKLFGLLGLTLTFVLAQAVFLARHLPDSQPK